MKWENLTNQEQVYLYWQYLDECDDDPISFSEFDELMKGITIQ